MDGEKCGGWGGGGGGGGGGSKLYKRSMSQLSHSFLKYFITYPHKKRYLHNIGIVADI